MLVFYYKVPKICAEQSSTWRVLCRIRLCTVSNCRCAGSFGLWDLIFLRSHLVVEIEPSNGIFVRFCFWKYLAKQQAAGFCNSKKYKSLSSLITNLAYSHFSIKAMFHCCEDGIFAVNFRLTAISFQTVSATSSPNSRGWIWNKVSYFSVHDIVCTHNAWFLKRFSCIPSPLKAKNNKTGLVINII